MDKNAIKKYAIWARRELIERVTQRAMTYGITAETVGDPSAEVVGGRVLSPKEKRQRQALIKKIKEKSFDQVVEEVAYTWFNRFAALRFMEVNGYLPTRVRVFTNENGDFKPQILSEALHLDLEGLGKEKVYELESANRSEDLYKYLLVLQCNDLYRILPGIFQRIEDYTELLFPDYLLRERSVVEQMVSTIPEADWTDQVQIIGWLYQYYNAELKEKVFADLKKNIKIAKENIPAATQLFTPDWIVRYMVENSLGRLWLEGHPNESLKSEWKYYLDEADQEPEVETQLAAIRKEYAALKPEEIRVIDPCMGSGHILCVFFDVLVRIYEQCGYSAREAAVKIVENNLWGLDIDERASQLAYFAVMMKARRYDRRFFERNVQPHVYAFQETNVDTSVYERVKNELPLSSAQQETLKYLTTVFVDAKEFGSILQLEKRDYQDLKSALESFLAPEGNSSTLSLWSVDLCSEAIALANQAIALTQTYHVVATNPPYMGVKGMEDNLANYVKAIYPNAKYDLFSGFIEQGLNLTNRLGFLAMITMESWMFLSSFERLRQNIISSKTIRNLVHMPYLGKGGTSLGINFGTSAFVLNNFYIDNYVSKYDYIRYYETDEDGVPYTFPTINERFKSASPKQMMKIPGSPIAYWVGDGLYKVFENGTLLSALADARQGLATADNNRFLRFWYEPSVERIKFDAEDANDALRSKAKWFPYNKGGEFRKWYGNNEYVVNWENDGFEIKHFIDDKGKQRSVIRNPLCYFKESASWSQISFRVTAFRFKPYGHIFDVAGMCFFSKEYLKYLLGLCNTVIVNEILNIINPTISNQCGDIANIPVILNCEKKNCIEKLVDDNIEMSKRDWDSFETSWDFQYHPLVNMSQRSFDTISKAYSVWERICKTRFELLHQNEEELNRIFISIYDLDDEFSYRVEEKYVSIRKADLQRDVRSFVSYAVGCMFGRYSLDVPGLVYAGGEWDASKYATFPADSDAIIPICDDEYFEDDIVGRFVKFVEVVFGKETLEENLRFIADALGGKGSARDAIRKYFINDFYADHLKIYQKRPIYWLFDSGKKNGFKCLVYMHRYQRDTLARIRTDYVHEQQARYRSIVDDLEKRVEDAATSERVKLSKRLAAVKAQTEELRVYEEKIHHLADKMIAIDLDDGVVHNYEIFKDVLAKRK